MVALTRAARRTREQQPQPPREPRAPLEVLPEALLGVVLEYKHRVKKKHRGGVL